MIGFNPTPELMELLTHHHKRHKSIHLQANNQLQIKSKTHEITNWSQISSRNPHFESKSLRLLPQNETSSFLFLGTSNPQASTPHNLTLRSYL